MKRRGFTLVELLAVIVVLAVILAIAIPGISGIIKSSMKASFESDAKLVLKAIDYQKLANDNFDVTSIDKDTIVSRLKLSNENYNSVDVIVEEDIPIITIVGQNKWDGLIACGTYNTMRVVESSSDCSNDLLAPALVLVGSNPLTIFVGELYNDDGATAIDNKDGNITDRIVVTGTVNPNVPGEYTITYTVSDNAGNASTLSRTVNVVDNENPVISFNPMGYDNYAKSRNIEVTVNDLGVINNETLKYVWTTSLDEPSLDAFVTLFANGDDISTPTSVTGVYYLWVIASDTSDNTSVAVSNAVRLDNIYPVITLIGETPLTITKGSAYNDAGATATDNIDANITVTTTGSVNPNVVGTYTIIYDATDSSGNAATSITRTINVVDASAPAITILGSNPVNLNVGTSYTDAGATAMDDVDGDVTSNILKSGTVNSSVVGTYTITYRVSDSSGNEAISTRTVNVIDNVLPTVAFGTNGNSTYAKTRSTTVTVSDAHSGVNTSSLKYQWTTSTTTPSEASFTASFTNGGTINTPSNVTGGYYLWILGKDMVGNVRIQRSNLFNLDNTIPVVSNVVSGSTNIMYNAFTITRTGNATDAHSGLATNPYVYQISTNGTSWTTKCTNNTTTCNVTGLTVATTYYYRICVNDAAANQNCVANKTMQTPNYYFTNGTANIANFNGTYLHEDRGTHLYIEMIGSCPSIFDATGRPVVYTRLYNIKDGDSVSITWSSNAGGYYTDAVISESPSNFMYYTPSANTNRVTTFTKTGNGFVQMNINFGTTSSMTRWMKIHNIKINGVQVYPY